MICLHQGAYEKKNMWPCTRTSMDDKSPHMSQGNESMLPI